MYEYEGEKLLCVAAEPTPEVIAWLEAKVPASLEPVLNEMGEHLFEPGYSIAELKSTLHLPNEGFTTAFGAKVGVTPWSFIRECRLETAARLLRDTDLPLMEITLLVGYDSEQAFARLFHQWSGMRPAAYRRHARTVLPRLEAALEKIFTWQCFGWLCDADLAARHAAELIAVVEQIRAPDLRA